MRHIAIAAFLALTTRALAEPPKTAPEFTGISEWVQSKPLTMAGLRGKVVVVHFWTNGCINCIHNYPHYRTLQDKYANADVVIVGVHTPEFDSERDVARIKERAAKNGLKFPIAVDNASATWKAWSNRYWPAVYLVDRRGQVRYTHEGELGDEGVKTVVKQLDALLAEAAK